MMFENAVADDLNQVNLADPVIHVRTDMDRFWNRVRSEQPVYLHPATDAGPEFWVVSRYNDALAVYQDAETFSSGSGNNLPSLHKPGGDPAAGKMVAATDAPRHSAMRRMMLKALTPRVREFVVDRVQARADDLITTALERGSFDFAKDVADHIPIGTICDLLGFPPEDHATLLDLSREALTPEEEGQTAEDVWLVRNELLVHCAELAEDRREDPRDDLMSVLVNTPIDGEPLTEDEVLVNCYGLILAGDHTSRLAMVGAVLNFAQRPEQWQALRNGRVSEAAAVEEILRWTTPVMHIARVATDDVTLGGQEVRKGDLVTVWNSSANRDEAVFDDPEAFDLGRTPNKHLSFGYGPHFCFGSYLGRAEVAAVLNTLCRTVDSFELAGDPKRLYSSFLQGYSSLPISCAPSHARAAR
ncbi:cytochrome P450 [Streptomyces prunicolor]|uniref:Cytochrome P450 n=1 Tax=Streptomyces prunicolor TaxID=67348 RepID=A0ABU4FFK3_9ACTN|nr:cytochrome P450 [Streptomyces prunicolor]MCX5243620.1 cytochrome P450 [Streptomyces prunicolor]MDV7219367.1 cytochrome P450 [Streptomyces prunicolor]